MEQIMIVSLGVCFILVLMTKLGFFDMMQTEYKITSCLFCWSWWLCVAGMTAVQMPWYFTWILYALRQPTLLSIFSLNFMAVLFSAACASIITTFLAHSIIIKHGNN